MHKNGKSVSKILGGNRDTDAANCGSRTANWNNYPWNGNWNNGLRAACDDQHFTSHLCCYGVLGGPSLFGGQHALTRFGEYIKGFGKRRVARSKVAPTLNMGKKHKNLFPKIVDPDNLWSAYRKASLGKRSTMGYLAFKENEAANLVALRDALCDGSYTPGAPRHFVVLEPKPRQITALPFVDRVAQHAVCNVVEPIFDAVFLPQSYACRKGCGTHLAARDVQAAMRKLPLDAWVLKTDFSKYFASIDRPELHKEINRKVSCYKTLNLLKRFTPDTGTGIPIGNLTSQMFANINGHILDRWLVHEKGVLSFFRYMDDVVIFGPDQETLEQLLVEMESFTRTRMKLRFSQWSMFPAKKGVNFVGYRIWPTHKLLRKDSVHRAKRKLKKLTGDARDKFLAAWLGHASHANSYNLLKHLELV